MRADRPAGVEGIHVAASTGCLYDLDVPTEQAVLVLAGLGVDDVEVFVQGPEEMDRAFVHDLAATCRDTGMHVGSVHPYVFGFEHLLYTSYRRQRRWAWGQYERYLAICAELGAAYYVAHGPPRHHVRGPEGLSDTYRTVTTALAMAAESHGVTYCLENVAYGVVRDVDEAVRHRDALDVRVPFVLDFKSAWKAGAAPQQFAAALAEDIAYAHVSFVDREHDRYGVGPAGDRIDPDVVATARALTGPGRMPARLVVEVERVGDVADLERTLAAVRAHAAHV